MTQDPMSYPPPPPGSLPPPGAPHSSPTPPAPPAPATPTARRRDAPAPVEEPEHVGRGIVFSLLAVLVGIVLAVVIYQLGFIASISSFLMALAAGWLYTVGAGAPPRKGAVPLIVVIAAGVAVSLLAMLASELYAAFMVEYPDATTTEAAAMVLDNLFYGPVWEVFARDALWFAGFAALGTFSTLSMLARARKSPDGAWRLERGGTADRDQAES